jgi:hypothetical protein
MTEGDVVADDDVDVLERVGLRVVNLLHGFGPFAVSVELCK